MTVIFLGFLLARAAAAAEGPDLPRDPYEFLTQVRSFYSLFDQKGLSAYSAAVEVKGSLKETLEEMAKGKNLPPPAFMEFYTRGEGFKFILKNPEYPPMYRALASEMFTPVLAFDRLIQTLESKRDIIAFEKFRSATRATSGWIQYQEIPHVRLQFEAKEAGGAIEKREVRDGESVKTISMLGLTFVVSPENHLVKVLNIHQVEKTPAGESEIKTRLSFTYKTLGGRILPVELTLEKNGQFNVRFKAVYRKNGNFIVFSRKIFQYLRPDGTEASATLEFRDYKFNDTVDKKFLRSQESAPVNPERETAAEKLYNSAKRSIMDGKAKEGKKILKRILDDFPETTYAGQAKTLLDGLPE